MPTAKRGTITVAGLGDFRLHEGDQFNHMAESWVEPIAASRLAVGDYVDTGDGIFRRITKLTIEEVENDGTDEN